MTAPVAAQAARDASMYEDYYGFVQSPFSLAPDPRFLYRSESHAAAIALLRQAILRKEGFVVLTGDIGTGKTTSCRALLEEIDGPVFASLVLNPFLSVAELLREVLLDFGVVSKDAVRTGRLAAATTHELVSTLHEFLLSLIPLNATAVLIIDEGQHLSADVLEQIRILSNLETNDSKLLQIVLVGQLNLLDVLASADMRQLDQRISTRATLKPLDRHAVEAYVSHRLDVARGSTPVVFESAALDRVHGYTGGVPRVINLLCDRALARGAEMQVSQITPAIVDEAARGLALRLGPAKHPLRRKGDRMTAPTLRWQVAMIVAAMVAALAGGLAQYAPVERLIDAAMPQPPIAPEYQPRYPAGPKPIPALDLPPAGPIQAVPPPAVPSPAEPLRASYPRFRG